MPKVWQEGFFPPGSRGRKDKQTCSTGENGCLSFFPDVIRLAAILWCCLKCFHPSLLWYEIVTSFILLLFPISFPLGDPFSFLESMFEAYFLTCFDFLNCQACLRKRDGKKRKKKELPPYHKYNLSNLSSSLKLQHTVYSLHSIFRFFTKNKVQILHHSFLINKSSVRIARYN